MATVTAINMAVKMSVDEVEKGTKLARNEIAALNRMYAASKTDAQRLEEGLKLVERGLADGSLTAEKAASITEMLTKKYGEQAAAAQAVADAERAINAQRKADLDLVNTKLKIMQDNYNKVTAAQEKSNAATRNAKLSVLNEQIAAMQSNMGRMTGSLNDFGRGMEDGFVKADEFAKANWRVSSATQSAAGGLGKFTALGGVAVGTIALMVKLTNEYLQAVESIANEIDVAAALGDSLANVQLLTQSIAELSGLDVSTVTSGLQQLQTQIGLAASGQGKSQKMLEMLGLDAGSLANMSATEQFNAVAESIGKIEERSTRAAFAQKLFGNAQIANAIASGEVAATMNDLSKTLFTLTANQEKAVGLVDDTWARITNSISSGMKKVVAEISEGIVAATGLQGPPVIATENTTELTKSTEQLVRQMEEAEAAAKAEAEAIKKAKEDEERAQLEYYNTIEGIEGKIRELTKGKDAQRAFELRQRGLTSEQTNEIMASEKKLAALQEQQKFAEDEKKRIDDLMKAGQALNDKFATPVDRVAASIAEMTMLVNAGAIGIATAEQEINRVIAEQAKTAVPEVKSSQVQTIKMSDQGAFKALADIQNNQQNVEKRQLWVQEQQYKALERIEANTRNQTGIVVAR